MAKSQKTKNAFCYEKEIGYVQDKKFIPMPFNFVTFLRLVIKHLKVTHCATPDIAMKKAILEYCEAKRMQQLYQGHSLSDSEFFNYYKNMVNKKAEFQQIFKKNLVAMQKTRETERKARGGKQFTLAKQRPACKSAYLLGIK